MKIRKNDDGSTTFVYESWDELMDDFDEPSWVPDADLNRKDRADQRIWGY